MMEGLARGGVAASRKSRSGNSQKSFYVQFIPRNAIAWKSVPCELLTDCENFGSETLVQRCDKDPDCAHLFTCMVRRAGATTLSALGLCMHIPFQACRSNTKRRSVCRLIYGNPTVSTESNTTDRSGADALIKLRYMTFMGLFLTLCFTHAWTTCIPGKATVCGVPYSVP